MDRDPPFILIVLLIFLVIIVVTLLWIYILKKPPILPTIAAYAPAQIGMRCSMTHTASSSVSIAPDAFAPQACDQGLVCVSAGPNAENYCRKAIGSSCTTIYECEPQALMCTGVCSVSPAGGINQPCLNNGSCNSGLQCVTPAAPREGNPSLREGPSGQYGGIPVCKYNDGVSQCSKSSDCVSGRCFQNSDGSTVCVAPLHLGDSCKVTATDTAPCGSQYVCVTSGSASREGNPSSSEGPSGSYCQPTNLPSSGAGAVCYYPTNGGGSPGFPTCQTGLYCAYDYVKGGPVAGKEYGYCAEVSQKWGSQCSDTVACAPPSICSNGKCILPLNNSGNSLINTCGDYTSYQCNTGFTCSNSICYSQSNQTCTYNTDCQSGNCGSWALMNWKMTPTPENSPGLGQWNNIVPISVAPQSGACLSVAQIAGSGTVVNTYALYYPGGGSTNFYIYNQSSSTSGIATYKYNIIASGALTILQIKSVKITPLGNILVHSNVKNTLGNPIRPGNPLSGTTTAHTYDRVFGFALNPNTNGTVTTISISDRVGPYFNGSTEVSTFDVYDLDDKNLRFGFTQSGVSTLWTSTLGTSSNILTTLNSFYSVTTTTTLPNWTASTPAVYIKYYIDSNGGSSNGNVLYLLKGSNVYTSVDQHYSYPPNPSSVLYGVSSIINTNNPISSLGLYYTTSTQFRYNKGTNDIQLPGYLSLINTYSTLTDPVPTTSLLSQGGIDSSLYTINQVCN